MGDMRRTAIVVAFTCALLLVPGVASAEFFANLFFGKASSIEFTTPTASSPSLWGVSAGGSPRGIFGGEFDYTSANDFFGSEAELGSNRLRIFSGSAHVGYPIKIGGQTRLRPYGVIGGGVGMADKGLEFFPDFDAINNLPQNQQQTVYNCLYGANFEREPTPSQAQACGVGVVGEESDTSYHGLMSYGGGVFAFIVPHVGARVDFRYYSQFTPDEDELKFWRTTFGVVIH